MHKLELENKKLEQNSNKRKILLEEFQEVGENLAPPFSSFKRLRYTFGEWFCLNFTRLLQQLGYNKRKILAIKKNLDSQEKIILNIGCSDDTKRNFLNAELVSLFGYRSIFRRKEWKDFDLFVELTFYDKYLSEFANGVVLSHVLEHIHPLLAVRALKNCFAYLKPGGCLRISVPDLRTYEKQNVLHPEISQIKNQTLAKNLLIYAYKHQFMYDAEIVKLLMEEAGFQNVQEASYRQNLLGETDVSKRQAESIYITGIKP
ncbi:MAG: methyltransferase domain-containing protein [Xenococcaceae cyanobacterium]